MNLDVSNLLTPLVSAGLAVWALVKFIPAKYAERLFGHYLDRRLDAAKQEQTKEIEKLKADLAHLSDRGVRSNEREYEAVSMAWEHCNEAFHQTIICVVMLIEHPDLANLSLTDAKEYFDTTSLSEMEKRAILAASDWNAAYRRFKEIEQINDAAKALSTARRTVRRQSVFIPVPLNDHFEEFIATLQKAYTERRTEVRTGRSAPNRTADTLVDDGNTLLLDLQAAVRSRLLREPTMPPPCS